jgi:mRNA-degrading endonuclease toxin of MazEF toxin-antitoxin module
MDPKPLEIYLAQVTVGICTDIRPCVVLFPPKSGFVTVACISAQPDMRDRNMHFTIDKDHPDFPATHLDRSSYIMSNRIVDIPLADLRKFLGRLEGEPAKEFKDWYGL